MDTFINQIFNLLVVPPGNLLYHLVVAFSIGIALQTHLVQSRSQSTPPSRRMTFGITALLTIQILLFIISGLGWQNLVNAQLILPPIDRAVTAFSIIWIIWLWVFPKPLRVADSLVITFNLIVAVALAFTLVFWAAESTAGFNNAGLDLGWEIFSLVLILTGGALMLARRPAGWPVGLGMLAILLTGVLLQIFIFIPGDFPGFVRLAQLAAYPLLTTLVQQGAAQPEASTLPAGERRGERTAEKTTPVKERRRYSADPKTVHAFLSLAIEANPKNMVSSVTRAIGQAMLADLCLLVTPADTAGRLSVLGGYDLIREESLEGCPLERADVPMLATAIQKGRPLRLAATHDATPDIKTLYEAIGISNPGNLLAVPLLNQNQTTLGAILLLSPYANRNWSTDDQTYLANTAEQLAAILYRPLPSQAAAAPQASPTESAAEIERLTADLEASRQQVQQMERVQKDLTEQLISVSQKASSSSQSETMRALMEVQEETQDLIVQLQAENDKLQRDLSLAAATHGSQANGEIPPDVQYLEGELRKALTDAAQLQNSLAEANMRIDDLEKQISRPAPAASGRPAQTGADNEHDTAIMMVIQELRRPVNSMVGQVDQLIQNTPTGGPSYPARDLERIKASVERILGLLDDLMEIVTSPQTTVELNPAPIDVPGLIDQVIAATTVEFREKNISLQVDLPEKLPSLKADLAATQKTLVHLLHNACEVTAAGGVVRIKVRLQGEALEDQYILYQITDSGGGINSADLPHLFSRFDTTNGQPIMGLGAPRSIAEARDLVEAQNGRIWVDTEPGSTTTLSFLLPLQQPSIIKDIVDE